MNRRLLLALLQRDEDLQRFLLAHIGGAMESLPSFLDKNSWQALLIDTNTDEEARLGPRSGDT